MTPIGALDTETTSLRPDRKAWEVAMIRRDDTSQHEIQFFIHVDLEQADLAALKVGRYFERHPNAHPHPLYHTPGWPSTVKDGSPADAAVLSEDQAAALIESWTRGAIIVGAVPNFDTEVLGNLLRAEGFCPSWYYHLVDVENLAVGYLASSGHAKHFQPPWSSDALGDALGVEPAGPGERHTALGDARWALRMYDAVMGGAA